MSTAVATVERAPARYALDVRTDNAALIKKGKDARAAAQAKADDCLDWKVKQTREDIDKLPERITPEEALRLVTVYDARETAHSDGGHLERFKMGVVARRISEQAVYGDRAMERLAELTGINLSTIRQCRKLAQKYDDNVELFARFLGSFRRNAGYAVRWYHVEKLIGTFSDPTVLGPELLAERLQSSMERIAEQIEQTAGDVRDDLEMIVLTDAARDLRTRGLARLAEATEENENMPVGIPRDPMYLRFVAQLPCAATGTPAPADGWDPTIVANDPHHVATGGTSIKGSDYTAIPLSREPHNYWHQHGAKAFRKKYGVHIIEIMFQTMHLYTSGLKADLPAALTA